MSIPERLFAIAYDPVTRLAESRLRVHRQYLARDLSGTVLDLGTGTGRLLPVIAATGSVEAVHAVDPNPEMRRRARERADSLGVRVRVRDGRAEDLPYRDGRFDAVLSSMVLCTVSDPDAALSEVERVLAPGGEFRLFEHVRADSRTELLQRAVEPLWRRIAAGCHLTRDTAARVASREKLDVIDLQRVDPGFPLVRPFVRGRFRRRSRPARRS